MRVLIVAATIIATLLAWTEATQAREVVRVGGYDFPPFVEVEGKSHAGLALDLVRLLNQSQNSYEFTFVPTSSRRRYADAQDARYDIMLFESPEWGWKSQPVDFTEVFLTGGEVYIARAEPGRGQDYFDSLAGKRLVGILGYHYGFANFEGDPDKLTKFFDIKLVNDHASSITMVLAGRVDIGVVTDAYLHRYRAANPDAKLLVSERYDQKYYHRALVRRGSPIDVAGMNRLLGDLQKSGALDGLWRKAGIR